MLKVAVIFDTAGFLRSLPLTGAAARTLHLNAGLAARGVDVRLYLCDLNPQSRPVATWPFPVTYIDYDSIYADPRRLLATLSPFGPDLLVMSNSQLTARYGRQLADDIGAGLVYEMHDDEGALLRSLDRPADEWRLAKTEQSAAARSADGVIVFSADDARVAQTMTAGPVHVVPCGVTVGIESSETPPKPVLSFVGNLFYGPNRRAVDYLRSPVFLECLERLDTSVDVYGRYPADLNTGEEQPVRLCGPVPYLRQAITRTSIGLAPLSSGGGMKLKVLEYMAAGVPVVGTTVAAAGFDEFDRFGLIGHDDLSDFPDLVAGLLADGSHRERLAMEGRRLAGTTYSWRRMAALAEDAYAEVKRESVRANSGTAALLEHYAIELPYWLKEWGSQQQRSAAADAPVDSQGESGVISDLAEAIDCARVAAQSRTGLPFPRSGLNGYGGRSVVYLTDRAALKVYTHRGEDRKIREMEGLAAASRLPGFDVPVMLAGDSAPGALSWIACRRIPGTQAKPDEIAEMGFARDLGELLGRLHRSAAREAAGLRLFRRSPLVDAAGSDMTGRPMAEMYHRAKHRYQCAEGFVHGDFSTRNVLVADGLISGIVDFERSGRGCPIQDVASVYLNDVLLGGLSGHGFLSTYPEAVGTGEEVDMSHLGLHLLEYAAWILGWAADIDPELAAEVMHLAPLLTKWSV